MFTYIIENDIELKLLDINHADEMFESICACKEHLEEYLPWVEDTKTVEDTIHFIKNSRKRYNIKNGFDAGIWYKGEFAGVIGYHSKDSSIKAISIGYWLDKRFVGYGIMTKACKVFIDYAFNTYNLNRVEIRCAQSNRRSRAIPERLGFKQEGIIRDGELLNNSYVDCIVYGLLKRDMNY